MCLDKLVRQKVIHDPEAILGESLGYTFWLNVSLILGIAFCVLF